METIQTELAPKPNGHYSQGIIVNTPLIFTSVQLPIAPTPHEKIEDIAEQARQVMRNIEAIVVAGQSSVSRIVRIMFYITKMSYWPVVDKVVKEYFPGTPPARGVVCVAELHLEYAVAAEAVASVG